MPEELAAAPIAVRASPPPRDPASWRILVLKLDHLGDFIIARPALESLRRLFPEAYIRFVCGSWNVRAAQASGLVDEVRAYDFFPEQAQGWDGKPVQGVEVFDEAVAGRFDIAIDLRVDGDTRGFLKRIDATVRCGIGARQAYGFLDIALPAQARLPSDQVYAARVQSVIPADRFRSRMRRQRAFVHESPLRQARGHIIFGPYLELPEGEFRAIFGLRLTGAYWVGRPRVTIEVVRNESVIQSARVPLRLLADAASDGPVLTFENHEDASDVRVGKFEFRVSVSGLTIGGTLAFSGVRLVRVGVGEVARFAPVELHVGEQLSLLVDLVGQRMLFSPGRPPATDAPVPADLLAKLRGSGRRNVMIAPFSNSSLRDWPLAYYERLVALLVDKTEAQVALLGSRGQAERLAQLAAASEPGRVVNLGGQTAWTDMPAVLETASLVICNNSGIAHLAAAQGAPTLAIYSASHPPVEWGPRGPHVETLMAEVACSPCGYDSLDECPHDQLCMKLITPEIVLARAQAMLAGGI